MNRLPLVDGALRAAHHAWRGGRLLGGFVAGRPVHCIVQVSNLCNLSCGFCSFWEHPAPRQDEMTLDDFEVISAKLAEAGSMVVSLEGGEPLLRNDVVGIVRAFARYHHPILFTNGWQVTTELAKRLWDAGASEIGVSIDYADADKHDTHRGRKGTFDAACRAVDVLRDSAPHNAGQVRLMTVVMHDNVDQLEGLLQLSAKHGVHHEMTLISTGGAGRHDRAQWAPPEDTGARLLALKRRYPHFVAFTGYLEGVDRFLRGHHPGPCAAGQRLLNIDHMGEVSPCIEKLHLSAGNLRREPWSVVYGRLSGLQEPRSCRDCYTSCRGFVDEMSGVPKRRAWREFLGNFANDAAPNT